MKRALALLLLALLSVSCTPAGPAAGPTPPVIQTGVDPEGWARVPAGDFFYGPHNHSTALGYDYEIMITAVTNAQYAGYLNEALAAGKIQLADGQVVGYYPGDPYRGHKHEKEIAAGDWPHLRLDASGLHLLFNPTVGSTQQFTPQPGYENHPVVQVTWFGARAYCEFYGWELPSEAEWEKAARGTDSRPYPWGAEIAPNNANYYNSQDPFEQGIGPLGDTTPVGFYNGRSYAGYQTLNSASPYGVYDMAGNVWQWTRDVYEGTHYRYLRGGSKTNYAYNLRAWTRDSTEPDYASPSIGFRCARRVGP